jgi:parallel beta-helix repeat protein
MAAAGPAALAVTGTLYVDRNATTCSDMGLGTQSQPYCTIGAAASAASPGTSVLVMTSGTYLENVNVNHSGSLGTPITFGPAPGASVTISGQSHGFTVTSQSWITITGFNITGTSSDGILLTNASHIVLTGNHVSYAGQPVSGQTEPGITLSGTTDSQIDNNTVDNNTSAGIGLYSGSTGVEVGHNLLFNNAAKWTRLAVAIDVQSASATVDYNFVYDNEDSGIQLYPGADNGAVFGNVTFNNGDHGIDVRNVSGGVVTGNTVYHNCTSGINVEGTSTNSIIENNIAVDNAVYPAYNGISCSRGTGNIRIADSAPTTTTQNFNLVYLTTAGHLYEWLATSYSSPALLFAATGQEANGIQADPTWVNSANGNFHLVPSSPAIDSANSAAPSEPAFDIEGNQRVDDPATTDHGAGTRTYDDLGAYEFQPSVSDTELPSMPTGLSAAAKTTPEVDLSWQASTDNVGVTGYTVYRNGAALITVSGSTLAYADTSVSQLTNYTYAIDALDAAGNHSPQSAPLSITVPDSTLPSVPTGVSATALSTTPQVNVSWSASTDNVGVTGYTLYRNAMTLTTVSGSTLTYADMTVVDMTHYDYTVDAFDAAGNHSAKSPVASVTTPDYTPPSIPTGLRAAMTMSTPQVNLSWTASTDNVGVTGYNIYRNGVMLATVSGSTLTYADNSVVVSHIYTYAVDAFDAAGHHSARSRPISVALRLGSSQSGSVPTPTPRGGASQSGPVPSPHPRTADRWSSGQSRGAHVLDQVAAPAAAGSGVSGGYPAVNR